MSTIAFDLLSGRMLNLTNVTSGGGGGGGAMTWSRVAGTTQAISNNNGYVSTNAALTTFTLPANASVGAVFEIVGEGAGGWTIAQNAGQSIRLGNQGTTTGAGGSLSSTDQYDSVRIICTVADTEFRVVHAIGNLDLT